MALDHFTLSLIISAGLILFVVGIVTLGLWKLSFPLVVGGFFVMIIFSFAYLQLGEAEPTERQIEIDAMMEIAKTSRDCKVLQDLQLEIIENWNRLFGSINDIYKMANERYGVLCN